MYRQLISEFYDSNRFQKVQTMWEAQTPRGRQSRHRLKTTHLVNFAAYVSHMGQLLTRIMKSTDARKYHVLIKVHTSYCAIKPVLFWCDSMWHYVYVKGRRLTVMWKPPVRIHIVRPKWRHAAEQNIQVQKSSNKPYMRVVMATQHR